MNNNTQPKPIPNPLQQIVQEIIAEARQDPETYLKEMVVPEGGE